jgi:hypothetical protein
MSGGLFICTTARWLGEFEVARTSRSQSESRRRQIKTAAAVINTPRSVLCDIRSIVENPDARRETARGRSHPVININKVNVRPAKYETLAGKKFQSIQRTW